MSKATSGAVVLLLLLCTSAVRSSGGRDRSTAHRLDVDDSAVTLAETKGKAAHSGNATEDFKQALAAAMKTAADKGKTDAKAEASKDFQLKPVPKAKKSSKSQKTRVYMKSDTIKVHPKAQDVIDPEAKKAAKDGMKQLNKWHKSDARKTGEHVDDVLDPEAKKAAKAGMKQLNKMASAYLEQGSSEMASLADLLGSQGRHDEAASLGALAQNLMNAEKNVRKKYSTEGNHTEDKLNLIQIRNSTSKALSVGTAYTIVGEIRKSKCTSLGVCIDHGDPLLCKMVVWFKPKESKSKRFSLAAYSVTPDMEAKLNGNTIGPAGKKSSGFDSNNERLIKQISNSMDDIDDRWRQIAKENGVDPDDPDKKDPLQQNKNLVNFMGNLVKGAKVKVPTKPATPGQAQPGHPAKGAGAPGKDSKVAAKIPLAKESDTQTWLWAEVLGLCVGVTIAALAIVGAIYYTYRRDVRTWHENRDEEEEAAFLNQPEQDDDDDDDDDDYGRSRNDDISVGFLDETLPDPGLHSQHSQINHGDNEILPDPGLHLQRSDENMADKNLAQESI